MSLYSNASSIEHDAYYADLTYVFVFFIFFLFFIFFFSGFPVFHTYTNDVPIYLKYLHGNTLILKQYTDINPF